MIKRCCLSLPLVFGLVCNSNGASIDEINRFDELIDVNDVVICSADFELRNNNDIYKIDSWALMKVISAEKNKKRYHLTQYLRLHGSLVPYIRYEGIVMVTREKRGGKQEIDPDSVQVFYPADPEQEGVLTKEIRKMPPFYYSYDDVIFTHFPDYMGKVKYPAVEKEVMQYCRLLGNKR